MQLQLQLATDSATPALRKLMATASPGRLAETLRDPLLKLVRNHYLAQPPNKMRAPSTGYWRSAAASTYAVTGEHGLSITTDKIGVRQHLYGGPINPIKGRFLSIPACIETHGKLPRDFADLVVARLGRGQDAPLALVKSADLDFIRNAPNDFVAATKAMFWLSPGVQQAPDPSVIPSEEEFDAAIDQPLGELLRTN
jgi:hypothetical protein